MKSRSYIPVLLFTSILLLTLFSFPAIAQVDEDESTPAAADSGSGVGLILSGGNITNIKIGNWTEINITVVDSYDLNWTALQRLPFPEWWMKTVWRIQFGIPDIERYLGYTQIRLEPEVITDEGKIAEGWSVKFEPNTIKDTTQGMTWPVKMYAKVNRLASEYNPIVRVKCIRYDVQGNYYNESYSYIPIKSVPRNFAVIETTENTKKASPYSMVYYTIKVTNEGEYKDVFQFDVQGKDGVIGLISEQVLVLDSGETKYVKLSAITPDILFDAGTARTIDVSVYSFRNPEEKYSLNVVVITEGAYLSPIIIFFIGLILLVFAIIFYLYENYMKSAPKYEQKKIKEQKPKKQKKVKLFSNFFKDLDDKNKKVENKQEPVKKEEILETEVVKEEPIVKPKVDRKTEEKRRKKEKALAKIRKKQGK
jgi:hypothetical protein